MNIRNKYLFKNIGILTISNFSSKILVFLLVPIYTSVLSVDDVGTYDLIVSTISLAFPILTMNIVDGVMRFTMEKTKDKQIIVSIGIKYIIISWCIFAILLNLIKWLGLFSSIIGYERIIYLYFVFYTFNQFMNQLSKGLERVLDMGIAGILSTVIMFGGNIYSLFVLKSGLRGFITVNVLSQIVSSFYFILRLELWKYLKNFKVDLKIQKEMLLYSVPLIASTIGWWINSSFDKYIVTLMCGITANGLLAVAYKIPQIINTIQGIFIQAWRILPKKRMTMN